MEGPYCSATRLDLRAHNQHPDYWKQRPPPSLELRVHRIDGRTRVPVPFRVKSSGAGAPRFAAFTSQQIGADTAGDPDRYVEVLDLQYQYAPPGFYQVVARYTPPADAECPGPLESTPSGVSVYEAGDSLSKLCGAAGSR